MTLVILSPCIDVKDGTCTEVCPVDCIYEGERMFYIHPTECIECALCESICPVDAIRYDDEVSPADAQFLKLNGDPFRNSDGELDQPGGWSRNDAPLRDPAAIRDFPETGQMLPSASR